MAHILRLGEAFVVIGGHVLHDRWWWQGTVGAAGVLAVGVVWNVVMVVWGASVAS